MEIPDHPFAAYWYALGKFMHRYAEIETTMHQVLRIVSNVPDRTAKVIYSGTRIRDATGTVKRFYAVRGQELPATLEKAFGRVGELTTARDRLLHNGISFQGGKAVVTDETKNISKRAFKHTVSVANLDALEADAFTVNANLVCFWIEARRPDMQGAPLHLEWQKYANAPWQYKPPPPIDPQDRFRSNVRERRTPPQS